MTIDCKHPFIHAGAGRTDRLLKALMPSNVALDNREMADLMVFAARFGKVIKYWDSDNAPDGDWSCFWESDYLFFLATVAAANTEGSKKQFKDYELAFLNEHEKPSDINPTVDKRPAALFGLVETTRALAIDVATWGQRADGFPNLQKDITAIVRNTLRQPLRDLIAYAKELSDKPNCAVDYAAFISTQNRHPFATEWNITQYEFDQNINFIDPRADYLATWQDLKRIFKRFGSAHERIRKQAEKYLKTTQNDPNQRQHSPHIALFMSFLHLFKHLQDQLNALPEKHLDYYYNDILHLQNRGEIPDHAHLVFQLALNVYQQTLPVGTLFRAGKAPDGKDMFYSLERPLTLNQAQVVEVKTLLVQDTKKGGLWENTVLDTDKTNTIPDKMKEVLPFRPLGNAKTDKRVEVGFAISSAVLSKSKAYRTVVLNFKNNGNISKEIIDKLNANLTISITTKDIKKPLIIKALGTKITVSGICVDEKGVFLKGVKISVKGLNIEKISGLDGVFTIPNCPNNATLDFNLDGYDIHSENINGKPNLGNITMVKSAVLPSSAEALAAIKVSGRCIDKAAEPLVGVSVVVKGTTKGTLTDIDGKFALADCPDDATLVFSFVGYETREESVKARSDLGDIKIKEGSDHLGEVVVTGYGRSPQFNNANFQISSLKDGSVSFRTIIPTKELPFDAPNNAKGSNNIFKADSPVLKVMLDSQSIDYEEIYEAFSTSTFGALNTIVNVRDLTDFDIYEGSFTRALGHTQNVDLTSAYRQGGLIVRCDEAFKGGLDNLSIGIVLKETDTASNFAKVKSASLFINGKARDPKITPVQVVGSSVNITKIKDSLIDIEQSQEQLDGYVVIELERNPSYVPIKGINIDPPTFANVTIGYTIQKDLDATEFFHLTSHSGHAAVNPVGSALMPLFPDSQPVFPKVTEAVAGSKTSENTEGSSEAALEAVQPRGGDLQVPNVISPTALFRGNLFIGVKEPPTLGIVSLLFQVADGTEIDLDSFPPDIDWSYLSENDWKRFPSANIVFDSTKADETSKRSLVQSGVIEFQMPADAKKENTLLNPAYYWLRASATETATPISTTVGALPSLLGIYAQAGSVRLLNSPMDARHFAQALAPTTINQLKFRQAAVKQIEQPYAGFGGRAAEQGAAYHLRISERLRHKKRAITAWDYEHLVLEQFPEIRFVKCINHSLPKTNLVNGKKVVTLDTRKTGAVGIVVMPLKTTNPLRPQVNRSTLENIQSYLKKYSNGFTSGDDLLKVIPPQYQAVVVSLSVKFHAGDTEKHVHNLDNDLARFIAPWAFDGKTEPTFGETLHKTALLSQIEALDYVDYIEDFYITDTLIGTNITTSKGLDAKEKVVPRTVVVNDKLKTFIAPKDALTLLTAHQLDGQTPFEINHSIRPL